MKRTHVVALFVSTAALGLGCAPSRPRPDAESGDSAPLIDAPSDGGALVDAPDVFDATIAPDTAEASLDAPAPDAPDAPVPDGPAPDAPRESSVEPPCTMAGYTHCAGACVDLASSAEHCGACGARCVGGANETATCIAGECDRGCMRTYGDCDLARGNGCETALTTVSNCGACNRRCGDGELCSEGACARFETLAPPRPLAPLSGARIARRRPLLSLRYATTELRGAELQLCRTRACTDTTAVLALIDGETFTPASDLAPGVYYWRVRGRYGTRVSDRWSAVWQFRVLPTAAMLAGAVGYDADFNGDGRADLAAGASEAFDSKGGAFAYYGAAESIAAEPAWVGRNAASMDRGDCYGSSLAYGDFNGDGFVDLAVSDGCIARYMGRTYLFYGSALGLPAAASQVLAGPEAASVFGAHASAPGDVDRDGYADLLVGAPEANNDPLASTGVAYVLSGRPAGTFPVFWSIRETMREFARLGSDVSSAGDINGDGRVDLLVGARGADTRPGFAQVFLGVPTGLPLLATHEYAGPAMNNSRFGGAMAPAGDIDGDGFADVLIGAPGANSGRGLAWLLRGSAAGLGDEPAQVLTRTGDGGALGSALTGADDLDGDGFADVALVDGCRVIVLPGSAAGLRTRGEVLLTDAAGSETAFCGATVSMVGDVDGDAIGDLFVGAPGENGSRGGLYVFRGAMGSIATRPWWHGAGTMAGALLGSTLARW